MDKMNDILVDVIIPTFNRADSLRASIESVLNQTHRDLELYVVDDASDDNTRDVIAAINDERLHYLRVDERSGANHCRNLGAGKGCAKYIAFNDSDDIWDPDKLEKQLEFIDGKEAGLLFTPYTLIGDESSNVVGSCSDEELQNIKKRILLSNIVGTPTILVDRSVFESVGGFDESLPRMQDWDFVIRVMRDHPVHYLKESTVNVYRGSNRITDNTSLFKSTLKIIIKKNTDLIEEYGLWGKYARRLYRLGFSESEVVELLSLSGPTIDRERDIVSEYYASNDQLEKVSRYLNIMSFIIQNRDLFVETVKKCGCHDDIAIYGYSEMGRSLERILTENGFCISAFIDNNAGKRSDVIIVSQKELKDPPVKIDLIINTVLALYGKIDRDSVRSDILELEDIIHDMQEELNSGR